MLIIFIFQLRIVPNLFFDLLKLLSSIKNDKIASILTFLNISGIWPKTSPTILLLHLSLLYLNPTAPQLSHLSLKLNSSLKRSLLTPLWTILGISFRLFYAYH